MNTKTYHYIVKGIVQGVFFRYHTARTANNFLIRGTVKNLPTGDVEVYARGDEENIEKFEAFLHSGPPSAKVEQVIKEQLKGNDKHGYTGFEIIY